MKVNQSLIDQSLVISSRYSRFILCDKEDSQLPAIAELISSRKGGDEAKQIIVTVHDHGSKQGNLKNWEFFERKLTTLREGIERYNEENPQAKVRRVKLNLLACHGDKVVMSEKFQELIKGFCDLGLEVRVSAIEEDQLASAVVGNGKNLYNSNSNADGVVMVERLFTSQQNSNGFAGKEYKYHDVREQTLANGLKCFSGEKHYSDVASFMRDEYEPSVKNVAVVNHEAVSGKNIPLQKPLV